MSFNNLLKSKKFILLLGSLFILIVCILIVILFYFLNKNQTTNQEYISYPVYLSYPESFPVIIQNPNIEFNWPSWYKTPNFSQLSQQQLQLQSPIQSSEASKIRSYYSSLSNKNFEEAQEFGPRGRSIQDYKNLYEEVDKIILAQLKNISGKNYDAKVFLIYKNKPLEEYKVNINLSEDGSYILGSTANLTEDSSYYIECDLYAFAGSDNLCLIRDDSDGEANYILSYGITETPYLLKGKFGSENTIYLVTKGGEFSDISIIIEYNFSTRKLKYIDTLSFVYPGPFGLYDYTLCINQDINRKDFYSGCLYDNYRNDTWFKENVRYLEGISKYIIEGSSLIKK